MGVNRGQDDAESACPAWCVSEHQEAFAEDNEWHDSELLVVPAMEMRTLDAADGRLEHVVAVCALEVGLEQHVAGEEFVHLSVDGERARALRLTVESIERLLPALRQMLDTARQNDVR